MSRISSDKSGSEPNLISAEALRMLETMAGGIAHDYNNILTIILGNLTLARSYMDLSEEAREIFMDIEKAIQSAREITDSLIEFSKPGTLKFRRGSIADVIKSVMETVFTDGNVTFDLSIEEGLWDVEFDHFKLEIVLRYILQFIKSESYSKRNLKIRISNTLKAQQQWQQISITDINLVLLDDKLENLFIPAFSMKKKNNGMGLITAFSLITKHQGILEVSSEAGKGTLFTILLPALSE